MCIYEVHQIFNLAFKNRMNKGFNKLKSGIFLEDRVNEEDIEQIKKNKRCKTITLTRIKSDNLNFLLGLKSLNSLKMYNCKINDYSALSSFESLTDIFINGIKSTEIDFSFLSKVENLEKLGIGYVFHFKSFPDLSSCVNLKRVSIFNCKNLTDISKIMLIPNLNSLGIVETPQKPLDLEFIMKKKSLTSMSGAFGGVKVDKLFRELLENYDLQYG